MVNASTLAAPKPAPTLAHSLALGGADLKRVDALILDRVSNEIPLIRDIARHIIASGGKRLRPLLTLLTARACGYEGARHVALAAAVEFIHTATLLHDDVVDESKLRRGLATANDMFGNKASVLVGDFILAQAFQLMVADGSLRVLKILSDAAATISKGEVRQLMTAGEPETPEEAYLEVITGKTAALFAAACEVGAAVAGQDALEAPLAAYGEAIGIAFQLVDDALDYCADESQLGKALGDDFREGKVTLPVIIAYESGTDEEKIFWNRTLSELRQEPGDLARATAILQKHKAIAATFEAAQRYCRQAARALAPLPESQAKAALIEIVEFCAGRMY